MKLRFEKPRFIIIKGKNVKCMVQYRVIGAYPGSEDELRKVVAEARCNLNTDKFDEVVGQRIAFARCKAKAYKIEMAESRQFIKDCRKLVTQYMRHTEFLKTGKNIVNSNKKFIKQFQEAE